MSCPGGCSRPLDYKATSDAHALNLLRKHYREHHAGEPVPGDAPADPAPLPSDDALPAELDLSAALRWVLSIDVKVEADELPPATLTCALATLAFLTGLTNDQVYALAQRMTTKPTATYVLPPF